MESPKIFFFLFFSFLLLISLSNGLEQNEKEKILWIGPFMGEGVANWRAPIAYLMAVANSLGAKVIPPCLRDGRLASCCVEHPKQRPFTFFFDPKLLKDVDLLEISPVNCSANFSESFTPLKIPIDDSSAVVRSLSSSDRILISSFSRRSALPKRYISPTNKIKDSMLPTPAIRSCADEFLRKAVPPEIYDGYIVVNWRIEEVRLAKQIDFCSHLLVKRTNEFRRYIAKKKGIPEKKIATVFLSDLIFPGKRAWAKKNLIPEAYERAAQLLMSNNFSQTSTCQGEYISLVDLVLVEGSLGLLSGFESSHKCSYGRNFNRWMIERGESKGVPICGNWFSSEKECSREAVRKAFARKS